MTKDEIQQKIMEMVQGQNCGDVAPALLNCFFTSILINEDVPPEEWSEQLTEDLRLAVKDFVKSIMDVIDKYKK